MELALSVPEFVMVLFRPEENIPKVPAVIVPAFVIVFCDERAMAALPPTLIDAPGCTLTVTLFCDPLPTPVTSAPVQVTLDPLAIVGPPGTQAADAGATASVRPAQASAKAAANRTVLRAPATDEPICAIASMTAELWEQDFISKFLKRS